MKFSYLDKRVFLQGLHPSGSTLLDGDRFFNSSTKKGLVLQIEVVNNPGLEQSPLPTTLSELLNQFSKVFEIPSGLPPFRGHEHQITLKEGTSPICE